MDVLEGLEGSGRRDRLALDGLHVAENLANGARFQTRLWAFHADLAQDAGRWGAAALARGQIGLPAISVEGVAQQRGPVLLGGLVAGVDQQGSAGVVGG